MDGKELTAQDWIWVSYSLKAGKTGVVTAVE
jgi:hypothetical protein